MFLPAPFISSAPRRPLLRGCLAATALLLAGSVGAKSLPPQVLLNVDVGTPVLLAGQTQRAWVKVAVTGFEQDSRQERIPANLSIVLDRSSSMSGVKIERAREAAIMAVRRLSPDDIVSIVSYSSGVEVVVPATKVGDGQAIIRKIRGIRSNGSTALFAGVAKGAAEVKKFFDAERVNRVILLSDGLANVGPATPSELGRLGASLGAEGIAVTTIGLGLGYNEDLMTQLAGFSDGNHAFVENANDLSRIFAFEFGDVMSVVAKDVSIEIHCGNGIKPIRLLGRPFEIEGNTVRTRMNQLLSKQEKYVVLEVEVPAGRLDTEQEIAAVDVGYLNLASRKQASLNDRVAVRYSNSQQAVIDNINQSVQVESLSLSANETSKQAVQLRDQGRLDEAKDLLTSQASSLRNAPLPAESPALEQFAEELEADAEVYDDDAQWNRKRKELRAKQYKLEKQQTY